VVFPLDGASTVMMKIPVFHIKLKPVTTKTLAAPWFCNLFAHYGLQTIVIITLVKFYSSEV